MRALVLVRGAVPRSRAVDPLDRDPRAPGPAARCHVPDLELEPGEEPEEPLEPPPHGLARMPLPTEGMLTWEHVVDVLGHFGQGRLPVPLAQPLEAAPRPAAHDGVVHAEKLRASGATMQRVPEDLSALADGAK